ncbi:DUF3124 domain-containing protein [Galbibacter mesophilus]|uniref:DUF3124 domain-containing protein n=1 Tax=Galbibacter mesophilus TaxID=379069 RepID=UPI00191FB016|nr:DUF3124 domain-containing protein [Galbibacter mesophilus]MCM5662933.1 DUF3124 domain-containing protein [Galbibacter mesophilus]
MKNLLVYKYTITVFLTLSLFSCEDGNTSEAGNNPKINWEQRQTTISSKDSLKEGKTYLSVYSQIYSYTQDAKQNLTTTVSMRNISETDTIFITKANYYNENGKQIRSYMKKPIFMAPLETLEIVIASEDNQGGPGGNFIFNWVTKKGTPSPHFEAVMISTAGQQGLSFTTTGIQIK